MQYTYEVWVDEVRKDVTTNFAEVLKEIEGAKTFHIIAVDNLTELESHLVNQDQIDCWQVALERACAWSGKTLSATIDASKTVSTTFSANPLTLEQLKPKDHINPSHYQNCLEVPGVIELQWLEHIQYHHHFRDPKLFKAAVELQIRKYLDRSGGKDSELQEVSKALWYTKFLAAYIKNNNKPIFVKDIDTILAKK